MCGRCPMWKLIKVRFSVFSVGGTIVGVVSSLALFAFATGYGFGPVLEMIVDSFDEGLRKITHGLRFDMYADYIRTWIVTRFGFDLELHHHWRYVFVLISLYMTSRAVNAFKFRLFGTVLFYGIAGVFTALTTGVVVALIPLSGSTFSTQFLIGFVPVLGVTVYWILSALWFITFLRHRDARLHKITAPSWGASFKDEMLDNLLKMSVAGTIIFTGLLVPSIRQLPMAGLVMFAVVIIIYTGLLLFDAIDEAKVLQRKDESFWDAYGRSGDANVGRGILRIIGWTIVTVLVDVGWKLA